MTTTATSTDLSAHTSATATSGWNWPWRRSPPTAASASSPDTASTIPNEALSSGPIGKAFTTAQTTSAATSAATDTHQATSNADTQSGQSFVRRNFDPRAWWVPEMMGGDHLPEGVFKWRNYAPSLVGGYTKPETTTPASTVPVTSAATSVGDTAVVAPAKPAQPSAATMMPSRAAPPTTAISTAGSSGSVIRQLMQKLMAPKQEETKGRTYTQEEYEAGQKAAASRVIEQIASHFRRVVPPMMTAAGESMVAPLTTGVSSAA